MFSHRFAGSLLMILAVSLLTACGSESNTARTPDSATMPPTPIVESIRVNGVANGHNRLQITVPALNLLGEATYPVQIFLVLADAVGTYSYLAYPANQAGVSITQLDLSTWPLEIALMPDTTELQLWVLAVENTRYEATERYGIEALAASLAIGFHTWLTNGDPADDPLAAIVSHSTGALFEWYATVNTVGQAVITLPAVENWHIGLSSTQSPDGGIHIVYSVQVPSTTENESSSSEPPLQGQADIQLVANETFAGGRQRLRVVRRPGRHLHQPSGRGRV